MPYIEVKARAKINLSLDVLGKRPDGYHDVAMIMQTLEFSDLIRIETSEAGIQVESGSAAVPSGPSNTVWKAAAILKERHLINKGIRIIIKKNIPVSAGLAGGSADAAAVLHGVDRLFGLGITTEKLLSYGKLVGADVPYCVKGGTVLAEGIGERLTFLPALPKHYVVLAKPVQGISTAFVYSTLDMNMINKNRDKYCPDTNKIISALRSGKMEELYNNMKNVLETVTIKEAPVIEILKKELVDNGALCSMMSGSGTTVFGLFDSLDTAVSLANYINRQYNIWTVVTATDSTPAFV